MSVNIDIAFYQPPLLLGLDEGDNEGGGTWVALIVRLFLMSDKLSLLYKSVKSKKEKLKAVSVVRL